MESLDTTFGSNFAKIKFLDEVLQALLSLNSTPIGNQLLFKSVSTNIDRFISNLCVRSSNAVTVFHYFDEVEQSLQDIIIRVIANVMIGTAGARTGGTNIKQFFATFSELLFRDSEHAEDILLSFLKHFVDNQESYEQTTVIKSLLADFVCNDICCVTANMLSTSFFVIAHDKEHDKFQLCKYHATVNSTNSAVGLFLRDYVYHPLYSTEHQPVIICYVETSHYDLPLTLNARDDSVDNLQLAMKHVLNRNKEAEYLKKCASIVQTDLTAIIMMSSKTFTSAHIVHGYSHVSVAPYMEGKLIPLEVDCDETSLACSISLLLTGDKNKTASLYLGCRITRAQFTSKYYFETKNDADDFPIDHFLDAYYMCVTVRRSLNVYHFKNDSNQTTLCRSKFTLKGVSVDRKELSFYFCSGVFYPLISLDDHSFGFYPTALEFSYSADLMSDNGNSPIMMISNNEGKQTKAEVEKLPDWVPECIRNAKNDWCSRELQGAIKDIPAYTFPSAICTDSKVLLDSSKVRKNPLSLPRVNAAFDAQYKTNTTSSNQVIDQQSKLPPSTSSPVPESESYLKDFDASCELELTNFVSPVDLASSNREQMTRTGYLMMRPDNISTIVARLAAFDFDCVGTSILATDGHLNKLVAKRSSVVGRVLLKREIATQYTQSEVTQYMHSKYGNCTDENTLITFIETTAELFGGKQENYSYQFSSTYMIPHGIERISMAHDLVSSLQRHRPHFETTTTTKLFQGSFLPGNFSPFYLNKHCLNLGPGIIIWLIASPSKSLDIKLIMSSRTEDKNCIMHDPIHFFKCSEFDNLCIPYTIIPQTVGSILYISCRAYHQAYALEDTILCTKLISTREFAEVSQQIKMSKCRCHSKQVDDILEICKKSQMEMRSTASSLVASKKSGKVHSQAKVKGAIGGMFTDNPNLVLPALVANPKEMDIDSNFSSQHSNATGLSTSVSVYVEPAIDTISSKLSPTSSIRRGQPPTSCDRVEGTAFVPDKLQSSQSQSFVKTKAGRGVSLQSIAESSHQFLVPSPVAACKNLTTQHPANKISQTSQISFTCICLYYKKNTSEHTPECDIQYINRKQLAKHVEEKHSSSLCSACSSVAETPIDYIKKSMLRHGGFCNFCPYCNGFFSRMDERDNHKNFTCRKRPQDAAGDAITQANLQTSK